jgi:hypothetical protein
MGYAPLSDRWLSPEESGRVPGRGRPGAVTLIQRFGSALNLTIHFHMPFLEGVYVAGPGQPVFRCAAPPTAAELEGLVHTIAERIGRALERRGLLVRDCDDSYLALIPPRVRRSMTSSVTRLRIGLRSARARARKRSRCKPCWR